MHLNQRLLKQSLIGEYRQPLQHLMRLSTIPQIALLLTRMPEWAPPLPNGRAVQTATLLGPAFSITSVPDVDIFFGHAPPLPPPQPDAAATLFPSPETNPHEVFGPSIDIKHCIWTPWPASTAFRPIWL